MAHRRGLSLLFLLLSYTAAAQVLSFPTSPSMSLFNSHPLQSTMMDMNLWTINSQSGSALENPDAALSRLDTKAPSKARREFSKGYQLLLRKDFPAAVQHLTLSTSIYPEFVSAHNALGSAYLSLSQNQQARDEFARAVALDDHVPTSYLNLGVAELALQNYPSAEQALQKASSIAPLDLTLLRALAYGQFVNKDYPGVIATAHQVHGRKHEGLGIVHYFAAGAWEAQNNLTEAQRELETLLREEPKFAGANEARQFLLQLKADHTLQSSVKQPPTLSATFAVETPDQPTSAEATRQAHKIMQDVKEKNQIAEAEAAEPQPTNSSAAMDAETGLGPISSSSGSRPSAPEAILRASVDEVSVLFAAMDHSKPITNLTTSDINIHDDQKSPVAILGFRNESQLPLRLGLVIDTSDSISTRFQFEQNAATNFIQKVVTGKNDLGFVVGVNNSVLLVQDFTSDQAKMSHAIGELAPSGGTALWDAVAFAADKLSGRPETQPVARVLVVITDGENNSSTSTLKEAIEHAQHGEVAIYTVSTRDYGNDSPSAALGEHALRTLSELTGGAAFTPGSIHRLKGSLADMQQVIRGRYLVSYKPALFQRNGQYRTIDISARKGGHKLRIYARKGYYAAANAPAATAPPKTTTE